MPAVDVRLRPSISIFFGEPEGHLRQAIRNALINEGYRGLRDFSRLPDLRNALLAGPPDLLVIDTNLAEGDCFEFVHQVRYQHIPGNPFVPVIFTTWQPDAVVVRRIVDTGADDLLLKPLSPLQLLQRIEALTFNRKPFVVTSDYIGPDRRDIAARNASDIPQIEVPNTLKAKATGEKVNVEELQSLIDDAMFDINEQRLKRHSYQVAFLISLIVPAYTSGKANQETLSHVRRLAEVAEDVGGRLEGSSFEHIADLCRSLIQVAGRISDQARTPDPRDIELLKPLSDAILVGFNPDKQGAAIANEIIGMVRNYANKRKSEALKVRGRAP